MDNGVLDRIEARVIEALISFGAEPSMINREAELDEIDIDSLDLVELAQIVEEEFGVEITAEDAHELTTVGQTLDLVVSRHLQPDAER
jgi:acyl carrier protein